MNRIGATCCRTLTLLLLTFAGCGSESATSPKDSASDQKPVSMTAAARAAGSRDADSTPSGALCSFRFQERGVEHGFSFTRHDDMQGRERILEVMGGGAAAMDIDGDGWTDLWMSNGCRLPLSQDEGNTMGKLFRNHAGASWNDCSAVSRLVQTGFGFGCAAGDLNEDGFTDLYVARYGMDQLWLNQGDGTFRETGAAGLPQESEWSSSVAMGDLNSDGYLDIFVGTYVEESDSDPRMCPVGKPGIGAIGCPPAHFTGLADRILLSDGEGSFADASREAGLADQPGKTLGVLICDLGGDAGPEVYVANDGEANALWTRESGSDAQSRTISVPVLRNQALVSSTAFNEQGFAQGSMGIAAADLDRNGTTDLFLTHFFAETNTLYSNFSTDEVLVFRDQTRASGLGPPSLSRVGFGVASIDIDNNGWVDLVVANGHTNDLTWTPEKTPYRMAAQVFQNQGNGRFSEVSQTAGDYFQREVLGRGLAEADFNRDGRMDLVISHQLDSSVILLNDTADAGHSLTLRLVGRRCTRTPITAVVTLKDVEPIVRDQLAGGGSYQAASEMEMHFGLGKESDSGLTVRWPNGAEQSLDHVPSGYWIVREGEQRAWSVPF